MLQLIPIALVVYSFFLVRSSISTLPPRIPMHFNAAGMVDGWGTPDSLWLLVGAQAIVGAIFLLTPYLAQLAPGAVHFGRKRLSDFPVERRPEALSLLRSMAAWMNLVVNLFLVDILKQVLQAASELRPQIHPILALVLMIAGMAGILIYFTVRFRSIGDVSSSRTKS